MMGAVATRLTYDLTYDAPMLAVGEMLMDPAFREQVCDAQRALRKTVTVGQDGGGMKVVVDKVQAAEGIPGFAKKFVGDEIQLVQTERWSDIENASVEVVIPGKPGQMSGTVALRESGGTTTETVEMEIRSASRWSAARSSPSSPTCCSRRSRPRTPSAASTSRARAWRSRSRGPASTCSRPVALVVYAAILTGMIAAAFSLLDGVALLVVLIVLVLFWLFHSGPVRSSAGPGCARSRTRSGCTATASTPASQFGELHRTVGDHPVERRSSGPGTASGSRIRLVPPSDPHRAPDDRQTTCARRC